MGDRSCNYHRSIDEFESQLNGDDSSPAVLAILAAGRDLATQLGRIADHVTIEQIVNEASGFGRFPAGHPANQWPEAPLRDPNIATKDEATEALRAAQSV